ncbi:MAG: hypothetical protein KGL73_07925 [Burkholderiales bacterium]|nr:hypothetical protein [Burkholderiales bacterium]
MRTAPLATALLNRTVSPGPTIKVVEVDRVGNLTTTNHAMIGVDHRGLVQKMQKPVPGCTAMSEMGIPLPEYPLSGIKGSITVRAR